MAALVVVVLLVADGVLSVGLVCTVMATAVAIEAERHRVAWWWLAGSLAGPTWWAWPLRSRPALATTSAVGRGTVNAIASVLAVMATVRRQGRRRRRRVMAPVGGGGRSAQR